MNSSITAVAQENNFFLSFVMGLMTRRRCSMVFIGCLFRLLMLMNLSFTFIKESLLHNWFYIILYIFVGWFNVFIRFVNLMFWHNISKEWINMKRTKRKRSKYDLKIKMLYISKLTAMHPCIMIAYRPYLYSENSSRKQFFNIFRLQFSYMADHNFRECLTFHKESVEQILVIYSYAT